MLTAESIGVDVCGLRFGVTNMSKQHFSDSRDYEKLQNRAAPCGTPA